MYKVTIKPNEVSDMFELYKEYMKPFIEALFGWDELFQSQGFSKTLQSQDFSWILINGVKVGVIHMHHKRGSTKICLLIIFREHQRKGYSKQLLNSIMNDMPNGGELIWNCLRNNGPAISLYEKIQGVERTERDDFYCYRFKN